MPSFPANPGPATWGGPRPGSFRPLGAPVYVPERASLGEALEAVEWRSRETLAARLFVGFSVGSVPTYSLQDLIDIVREARERDTPDDPSASFIAQRGIYRYRAGDVVEEDGGQVIVIDTQGLPPERFEAQVVGLAEEICRRMRQELVVVELQKNGLVVQTLGVGP